MNLRDAQILNARKKTYYCNPGTQVHHGCEHGESLLSTEIKAMKPRRVPRSRNKVASRETQHGRYLDCGPNNWDDRDNYDN